MRTSRLVIRAFTYYRRTNAAVVLGVATAVAVLGGALLVGDSVRGSLRDLVLHRLGRTDQVVVSTGFFRDALADELRADEAFSAIVRLDRPDDRRRRRGRRSDERPARVARRRLRRGRALLAFSRRRRVRLGVAPPSGARRWSARHSPRTSAPRSGGTVLVRVARPSAVPIESLQGRKDDLGRTLRLTVRAIVGQAELGEFSLRPQQGSVRAVFVPLRRLQQELALDGRVNTLLVSARADRPAVRDGRPRARRSRTLVRRRVTLDDLGLTLRAIESSHAVAVESAGGLLDAAQAAAAERAATEIGLEPHSVFTYLANTLKSGDREVPYSLITAIDPDAMPGLGPATDDAPADRLERLDGARSRRARRRSADARVRGVGGAGTVGPAHGRLSNRRRACRCRASPRIAPSRRCIPASPTRTRSRTGIRRFRSTCAASARSTRTTGSSSARRRRRSSGSTSDSGSGVRATATGRRFASRRRRISRWRRRAIATPRGCAPLLDPLAAGLSVQDVRADGLAASRGSTDFGEYFTYFSFFLVLSALLLAGLFFRLGVEQRAREVGLLRAVGYTTGRIRAPLCRRGARGDGGRQRDWDRRRDRRTRAVMMTGLGSWWSGAVGTDALRLHVSATSLAGGVIGVAVTAMACLWWTLRGPVTGLRAQPARRGCSPRTTSPVAGTRRSRSPLIGAVGFGVAGIRAHRGERGECRRQDRRVLRRERVRCSRRACVWPAFDAAAARHGGRSTAAAGGRCAGWACGTPPIVRVAACSRSP